jgi:enoyl-CoA hydratase/carnithine racemase
MSDILEISRSGRVLSLHLNRPDKRNALSAALCREIVQAVEAADSDPSIGAVLVAARGPAFCAGMDLAEVRPGNSDEINRAHEQLFTLGARIAKPIVAAVEGAALGGGAGLVANCHIAIASSHASFGLTEIRLGLWPFLIFRAMTTAVGERRTLEMALTGRVFPAAEAKEIGLVHDVSQDAAAHAFELASAVAAASPTSIRSGMTFVEQVRGRTWQEAGEIARQLRNEVFESADFREGISAFREKRGPKWPSLA